MMQPNRALYICLGKSWSSKERAAIRDCLLSRKFNREPLLLCYPGSFVEAEARRLSIDVLYAQMSAFPRLLQFLTLKKLVQKYSISVVHCYDHNFLTLTCMAMLSLPNVPLFFSQFQVVQGFHRTTLSDLLIRRVDLGIVPFVEMEESLVHQLGIPSRKIAVCGSGLEEDRLPQTEKKAHTVGINIKPHIKKFEEIATLTNAAFVFQSRGFTDFVIYLHFEGEMENSNLVQDLKNQIMAWQLENNFIFLHGLSLPQLAAKVELWLELENSGKLEDGMLIALLQGIPILVPRNGVTQELFESYTGVGESYRTGDVRELKQKIQCIFNDLPVYRARAQSVHQVLLDAQGLERYREVLLRCYEQCLVRRQKRPGNTTHVDE